MVHDKFALKIQRCWDVAEEFFAGGVKSDYLF
jgi:hypothetical protein